MAPPEGFGEIANRNLARLPSTSVSASSINGDRPADNEYYGVSNLFDGGEHRIDGINYTSWLSDADGRHWVKARFSQPVTINRIMVELPMGPDGDDPEPAAREQPSRAPREFAVDITSLRDDAQVTEKLPSVPLDGFRRFYPLDGPRDDVVGVTIVFPGPTMIEVSEIEILGTSSRDEEPGSPRLEPGPSDSAQKGQ